MKNNIRELTTDELKDVFRTNYKLQAEVLSDYGESEMDYIEDILNCFRDNLNNWSVGFNNFNFIVYKDAKRLLEDALQAQEDYCFLPDKYTPIIEELLNKYSTLYSMECNSPEHLEDYLMKEVDEIVEVIIAQIDNILKCPARNELEDYFIEIYADARLSDSCYDVLRREIK